MPGEVDFGGATVELLRVDNAGNPVGEVLAETVTSITGDYRLTLPDGVVLKSRLPSSSLLLGLPMWCWNPRCPAAVGRWSRQRGAGISAARQQWASTTSSEFRARVD